MNAHDEAKALLSRIHAAVELLRGLSGAHISVQPQFAVMEQVAQLLDIKVEACGQPYDSWDRDGGRSLRQAYSASLDIEGVRVVVCQSRPVRVSVEPLPFSTEVAP